MAVLVGIDLVHIPRLAPNLEQASFVRRVFTAREEAYCTGRPERFAARWAVKEAAMKALGEGLGTLEMTDIEVTTEHGGPPGLVLHGRAAAAARAAGWRSWSVSISHDGDYATAVVLVVCDDEPSARTARRRPSS